MEQPRNSTEDRDFPGIMLLADPIDLPPGAGQDQLNLKSSEPGQASVRLGMLPVAFDAQS